MVLGLFRLKYRHSKDFIVIDKLWQSQKRLKKVEKLKKSLPNSGLVRESDIVFNSSSDRDWPYQGWHFKWSFASLDLTGWTHPGPALPLHSQSRYFGKHWLPALYKFSSEFVIWIWSTLYQTFSYNLLKIDYSFR